MQIKKTLLPADRLKPLPTNMSEVCFGSIFTDYMFVMEYDEKQKWHNAEIKPYQPLILDPAASVLHYGQSAWEGQKAFRSDDDRILLFRPLENARRLNNSLKRMCMPEIPEEFFLQAERELISLERRWISKDKGYSLYIRPTVIAADIGLGVKSSQRFIFYIILSPSASYFDSAVKMVKLWVSDFYIRAVIGGTGEAKTPGNYAGSLLALQIAQQHNCDQVLWLDAKEKKYIEELGAMNIFFIVSNKLVTPKLDGAILPGIIRNAILQLARDFNLEVEERFISINEIISGIGSGDVTEVFASGTAAVVMPVRTICYKNSEYSIKNAIGIWTQKFYNVLVDIQQGRAKDSHGWVYEIATDTKNM